MSYEPVAPGRYLLTISNGCPCGAQFCYDCGEKWKTCDCPQWHEQRLYERAEQVVAGGDDMQVQANAVAVDLIEEHDCTHQHWLFIRRERVRCEECSEVIRTFIFRCALTYVPLKADELGQAEDCDCIVCAARRRNASTISFPAKSTQSGKIRGIEKYGPGRTLG